MKLHSIICVSAVAAMAATASATDYYAAPNAFCRLKVASAKESTIIAIPFSNCGGAEGQIYVTNLVMTTGLVDDDTLLYNDGESWHAWEIKSGKWVGVGTSDKTQQTLATAADEFKVACGRACWLVRGDASKANSIYLYGQVNSAKTDVTIAAGTGTKPTYTIVACPSEAADFDVTTIAGAKDDVVILPAATDTGKIEYKHNGSVWQKETVDKTDEVITQPPFLGGGTSTASKTVWVNLEEGDVKTVPAGKGFMYGRVAASTLTLTWGD